MRRPTKLWRLSWVGLVWVCATAGAAAQATDDPLRDRFRPPTFGEIMGDQVRQLGSHLDERNRLAQQRAQKIQSFAAELSACGSCARRAQLQASLDYWKAADQLVDQAENAALSTMGLGQYRNIGELQVGMVEQLIAGSQQVEQQRQRDRELGQISMMVGHECKLKFPVAHKPGCPVRPLRGDVLRAHNVNVQACVKENDPLRLYANDQMVRQLCGKLANPAACVAENSIVIKAQKYNQAASTADMSARMQTRQAEKQDFERQREEAAAKREQDQQDRALRGKASAAELRALQVQRRDEFNAMVAERQRARRACEDG